MARKRRRFTAEFKARVAVEALATAVQAGQTVTLTLRLSNAVSAVLDDGVATGTIVRESELPKDSSSLPASNVRAHDERALTVGIQNGASMTWETGHPRIDRRLFPSFCRVNVVWKPGEPRPLRSAHVVRIDSRRPEPTPSVSAPAAREIDWSTRVRSNVDHPRGRDRLSSRFDVAFGILRESVRCMGSTSYLPVVSGLRTG